MNSAKNTRNLFIRPMTSAEAYEFVHWQYDPPHHVHNAVDDLSDQSEIKEAVNYFLQPEVNCHAIVNDQGELEGFCTFGIDGRVDGGNYEADALDIGMGLRPDLTGQGNGVVYVAAILSFAQRTFAPPMFRVTIKKNNYRAQKVWQKFGFEPKQQFLSERNGLPFIIFTQTREFEGA